MNPLARVFFYYFGKFVLLVEYFFFLKQLLLIQLNIFLGKIGMLPLLFEILLVIALVVDDEFESHNLLDNVVLDNQT